MVYSCWTKIAATAAEPDEFIGAFADRLAPVKTKTSRWWQNTMFGGMCLLTESLWKSSSQFDFKRFWGFKKWWVYPWVFRFLKMISTWGEGPWGFPTIFQETPYWDVHGT